MGLQALMDLSLLIQAAMEEGTRNLNGLHYLMELRISSGCIGYEK